MGTIVMSELLGRLFKKAKGAAVRLRDEESGVAAIEFAFIAPLLITIWLGTMEISQGIEVNKKVGRSASMIADIVTQHEFVTNVQLEDILKIGAAVLQPYQRDAPTITVSEIHIDAALNATVVWSRRGNENSFSRPFAPGASAVVPTALKIADTYLVKVETQLEYIPITSWSIARNKTGPNGAFASVNMVETYYNRPRVSETVSCTGC